MSLRKKLTIKTAFLLALLLLMTSFSIQTFAAEGDGQKRSGIDLGNWMSDLPNDWRINEINMPGTHDSGTQYCSWDGVSWFTEKYGKCQDKSIGEQLEHGIRVFDIRLNGYKYIDEHEVEDFLVVHGRLECNTGSWHMFPLLFGDVLEMCGDFLKKHPGETVLLSITGQNEDWENTIRKLRNEITNNSEAHPNYIYYYSGDKVPTLGEVRGKIVFFDNEELDRNMDGTQTNFENTWHLQDPSEKIALVNRALNNSWDQNFYIYRGDFANQEDKYTNDTQHFGEPNVKLIYTSANGLDGAGDYIAMAPTPAEFAEALNEFLDKYEWEKGTRYGWIMMDFPIDSVIKKIINTNFDSVVQRITVQNEDGTVNNITGYRIEDFDGNPVDGEIKGTGKGEVTISGLPRWTGRDKRNRYYVSPILDEGWSFTRKYNGTDKNGVESYTVTIIKPEKIEVKISLDCLSDWDDIADNISFKAQYLKQDGEETLTKAVKIESIDRTDQDEFQSVLLLQPDTGVAGDSALNGYLQIELVDETSGSSYRYDFAEDLKKTDDHHFEITLHAPGEYGTVEGEITFDDVDYSSRPVANNVFWDSFVITGRTADGEFTVHKKVVIGKNERGKDTVCWSADVPVGSPGGDEIIWSLSGINPCRGYNCSLDGLNAAYTLHDFTLVQIRWKDDTEETRPGEIVLNLYAERDGRKVKLDSDTTSAERGWNADFKRQDGETYANVEIEKIPDGYEITAEGCEDHRWVIELSYKSAGKYHIKSTDCIIDLEYANPGDIVTVIADSSLAPEPGMKFSCWEAVEGDIKFSQPKSSFATFVMPASDVWVKAVYKDPYLSNSNKTMSYKMISGADQHIIANSQKRAEFASDAPFGLFEKVIVDGEEVDRKYYDAREGSTVVTFNKRFLNTLSSGEHTLGIVSTDGIAETTFTVEKSSDNPIMPLWSLIIIGGVAVAALGAVVVYRRKKKRV